MENGKSSVACESSVSIFQFPVSNWSGRRGSNPRPTAWKAVTLPLSYSRIRVTIVGCPAALTLYSCLMSAQIVNHQSTIINGGQGRVRTSVDRMGRQIYSLLLLTAQPPVHVSDSPYTGTSFLFALFAQELMFVDLTRNLRFCGRNNGTLLRPHLPWKILTVRCWKFAPRILALILEAVPLNILAHAGAGEGI